MLAGYAERAGVVQRFPITHTHSLKYNINVQSINIHSRCIHKYTKNKL